MDPGERRFIDERLNQLKVGTENLEKLIEALEKKNVLNQFMVEKIKKFEDQEERKNYFFGLVKKRGPKALRMLYDSYMELRNFRMADLLRLKLGEDVKIIYSSKINDSSEVYPMISRIKGNMLLINIKNSITNHPTSPEPVTKTRDGSELDEIKLIRLWKLLGYEVEYHRDLNKKEFEEVIIRFRDKQSHKDVDSAVIFIMAHGSLSKGTINDILLETAKGGFVSSKWIIENFYTNKCPLLTNKPKMFFFQACRNSESHPDSSNYELNKADILVIYATLPGQYAIREPDNGAPFVQCLCSVFQNKACNTDLVSMLHQVSRELRKRSNMILQAVDIENHRFDRKLYFNPGQTFQHM